jgi:hypothetical protein
MLCPTQIKDERYHDAITTLVTIVDANPTVLKKCSLSCKPFLTLIYLTHFLVESWIVIIGLLLLSHSGLL